jgi:hypothetical protein
MRAGDRTKARKALSVSSILLQCMSPLKVSNVQGVRRGSYWGKTDMSQPRKTSPNHIHKNLYWDNCQISQLVGPLESPILTRYVILR